MICSRLSDFYRAGGGGSFHLSRIYARSSACCCAILSSFSLLVQRKRSKRKDTRAEAFLQLTLQNRPSQPKGGPRLPAFFTVNPPYASTSGGFPATPEFGFVSSVKHVYIFSALPKCRNQKNLNCSDSDEPSGMPICEAN
jgi:hypothetical protein